MFMHGISILLVGVGDSRCESIAVADCGAGECQVRILKGCVGQAEAKRDHGVAGVVSVYWRVKGRG